VTQHQGNKIIYRVYDCKCCQDSDVTGGQNNCSDGLKMRKQKSLDQAGDVRLSSCKSGKYKIDQTIRSLSECKQHNK